MVFGFIKKLTGKDNDLVKEGDELFNRGDYDKALAKYKKALKINKNNGDAKGGINNINKIKSLKEEGIRSFSNGNYNLALNKFEDVLKLNPNDKEAKDKVNEINIELRRLDKIRTLKEEGKRLSNNGDYTNALKKFEEVLKLNPNDKEAKNRANEIKSILNKINSLISEAENYLNKNEFDNAINKLEEVLKLNPNDDKVKNKILEIKNNIWKFEIDKMDISNYRKFIINTKMSLIKIKKHLTYMLRS